MNKIRSHRLIASAFVLVGISVSAPAAEPKSTRKPGTRTPAAAAKEGGQSMSSATADSGKSSPATANKSAPSSAATRQDSPSPATAASESPAVESSVPASSAMVVAEQPISLREFVSRLRIHNRNVAGKRTDRDIAATGIQRADAAFQPQLNVSATNGSQRQKNSFEEYLYRGTVPVYERRGQDVSVGVSQLVATGAKVEAKATLSRFITNINRSISGAASDLYSDDYYNRSQYGFAFTQPLLRDAGLQVTRARVRVAEFDTQAANHTSRETEASVVAEGIMAYYDLAFVQEKLRVAQERVNTGQRLLKEAKSLVASGRLPQSDVLEVENSLGRYQSSLSEAKQQQIDRSNRLRSLTASSTVVDPRLWRTADPIPLTVGKAEPLSLQSVTDQAKQSRDDLLMRRVVVERESTQIDYARNQSLPKLDFVANYFRNGYELQARDAFAAPNTRDFPSWSVGLQLNMPIGADRQAKADLQAAMLRKSDAQLAVDVLEATIGNDIDTTQTLRDSASERLLLLQDVAERERSLLDLERRRLQAGRSDMREILLREERALNAQLAVIEQRVALVKAETLLQAARGVLLSLYD